MNNKEYRSPEELAMQKALDGIREEFPDFWKDLEEFDEEPETSKPETVDPVIEATHRRKFRRRLIAACFIGVCILSTAMTIFINSDTAHAMKFAMEKKYYQAKGWVQATDDDAVNKNNLMIVVEDDENKIAQYEEFWEPLMYPGYMIETYTFKELRIEKWVNGLNTAIYTYSWDGQTIDIVISSCDESRNEIIWTKTKNVLNGIYEYKVWYDQDTANNGIDVIIDDICITVK
ncbi:MAG: hypothetical protein IKY08_07690, partial [Firmicutes bacterium]|nr:hypothetical protein [Bacillota bacterium]